MTTFIIIIIIILNVPSADWYEMVLRGDRQSIQGRPTFVHCDICQL